ncbi:MULTISPECIES: mycofactocin precursor MftA [unclassified Nocardioides]|nr:MULTISPECIES: mycofactocin precursor MftA [unclassified Nocardioides]
MQNPENTTADTDELTAEMLVEEVSIDGMCGVY